MVDLAIAFARENYRKVLPFLPLIICCEVLLILALKTAYFSYAQMAFLEIFYLYLVSWLFTAFVFIVIARLRGESLGILTAARSTLGTAIRVLISFLLLLFIFHFTYRSFLEFILISEIHSIVCVLLSLPLLILLAHLIYAPFFCAAKGQANQPIHLAKDEEKPISNYQTEGRSFRPYFHLFRAMRPWHLGFSQSLNMAKQKIFVNVIALLLLMTVHLLPLSVTIVLFDGVTAGRVLLSIASTLMSPFAWLIIFGLFLILLDDEAKQELGINKTFYQNFITENRPVRLFVGKLRLICILLGVIYGLSFITVVADDLASHRSQLEQSALEETKTKNETFAISPKTSKVLDTSPEDCLSSIPSFLHPLFQSGENSYVSRQQISLFLLTILSLSVIFRRRSLFILAAILNLAWFLCYSAMLRCLVGYS